MKTMRNLLMAGAASLLLATGAYAASTTASKSTASEQEQTRQLNLQAAQQGQTPSQAMPSQNMSSSDNNVSAPAFAPIALNSLSSPPDKIATAKVVDDMGTVVGAVQKVDLDASGKPAKVEIALLGSERIIALDSSRLSYDEPNNVMTAGMDKSQIAQLPAAPQS